jgi:DNA polymerase (family X)
MLLNEYGLFVAGSDERVASRTEEEIYAALESAFVEPTLREGRGGGGGCRRGPARSRQTSDIRGDLHYHTDRSGDGRSSLGEMVQAAVDAGYEYVAITDHGEDLAINGLEPGRDARASGRRARLEQRRGDIRLLFGAS